MGIEIPRYEDADLPGLPEKAWVITNSERNAAACPKRHWFGYTEGLSPKETACLLYSSPSPRDGLLSRMPSSA